MPCRSRGVLEHIAAEGTPTTLALVQALRRQPRRRLELHDRLPRALPRDAAQRADATSPADVHARLPRAHGATLGRRTGELHLALASCCRQRRPSIRSRSRRRCRSATASACASDAAPDARDAPRRAAGACPSDAAATPTPCSPRRWRSRGGSPSAPSAPQPARPSMRIHGDYHLGQVLLTQQRLRDHRFRGRAGRGCRGAPRQAVAAARRRRHAALVQLRARRAPCAARRQRRTRTARLARRPARLGDAGARRVPRRLRGRRRAGTCGATMRSHRTRPARHSSCWRRRCTSCATSSPTDRTGSTFRSRVCSPPPRSKDHP